MTSGSICRRRDAFVGTTIENLAIVRRLYKRRAPSVRRQSVFYPQYPVVSRYVATDRRDYFFFCSRHAANNNSNNNKMAFHKSNNVLFVVAVFAMLCAVRPSTVTAGSAATRRSAPTDRATGDAIAAAAGGVTAAAASAAGPFAPVAEAVGGETAGIGGGPTSVVARAADRPGRGFGCRKHRCWAHCGEGKQWCYTTRSRYQSFKYVTCKKDEDCDGCWECAGSCTL